MDKFDRSIIEKLSQQRKFDGTLVGVLAQKEHALALVRVHNPLHLTLLERNFKVTHTYPFIRSVGINCDLGDAIKLERMQEVEYVSAQGRVSALTSDKVDCDGRIADSSKARTEGNKSVKNRDNSQTNNVGMPKHNSCSSNWDVGDVCTLSEGLDGSGVTLCIMDTGVNVHSDISLPKERIVKFVDFVGTHSYPYDDNGHGTHVCGIACGNGLLSGREVVGVAPKANIVGLKVIGADGESGTFKILDGMQWLFDNFRQYGIRVVCMSFGADPLSYADPLKIGAEMLVRSGLIVVAAAGNSGENGLKSPGISSEVLSVGAVDEAFCATIFSSRGEYQGIIRPDVYARGVEVRGATAGGTYARMTGTSAAAPYVAGACCLLCQKYRNLTPRQAKTSILNASFDYNGIKILQL